MRRPTTARIEVFVLWSGLLIAFSPTLLDLFRHLAASSWARYALVFPGLFVRCALREDRTSHGFDGVVWVALGLASELVAVLAGAVRWARPGLALAAFGLCRLQGFGSARSAVLLFLAVPAPAFLVRTGLPQILAQLGDSATWLAGAVGLEALRVGELLVDKPGGDLSIARHPGLSLIPLLVGIGWYQGILLERRLGRAAATSAALALLWPPIQALAFAAAVLAAAKGRTALSHALLADLPWMTTAAIGIGVSEWQLRRGKRDAA